MTTVVLAQSYAHAYDAAQGLGLGRDWVYPHVRELLEGLHVARVVYVQGWLEGERMTEARDMLASRITEATPITVWPLDTERNAPAVYEPVMLDMPASPGVPLTTDPRPIRRLPLWSIAAAGGIGGAIGTLAASLLGMWTGWW